MVGTAMCLGGIAMADMAFAIGEDPDSALDDHGQKIAGHEIGHLLGGQHHYDNSAIVRGYAEKFVLPLPERPPPPPAATGRPAELRPRNPHPPRDPAPPCA